MAARRRIAPRSIAGTAQPRGHFINAFRLSLAAALLCALTTSNLFAANVEKSARLPVLSVSGERLVGKCAYLPFHYSRRAGDRTPLSIAVIEDTPGGAGESIRASIWLAAMVAALERHEALSGVRLSLELSGQVDGPSAGAVICLAILTALDGRDFPADCAATGTIMPDGTIGVVGGIGRKINAAAAAGIRRMLIPSYLRFEKDPATGEEVDLKLLASSLQVELIAVENVAQAYAVLHRRTAPSAPAADRRTLELPESIEEVLKRQYQDHHRAGREIWDAIPTSEREQIVGDAWMKSLFVDDRVAAENAYRSGRLALAAGSIWSWRITLEGRKKSTATIAALPVEDFAKRELSAKFAGFDRAIQKSLQAVPDLDSYLAHESPHGSATAAQFYADYYELAGMPGIYGLVQRAFDAELAEQSQVPKGQQANFITLFHLKLVQLLLADCSLATAESWQAENHAVAKAMSARVVTDDIAAVERLFFSVHLAARNAFRQEVIRAAADRWEQSDTEALQTMMAYDTTLVMHVPAAAAVERFHERLAAAKDPDRARFAAAVSAHLQAESLGVVSGLMTRWNELELEVSEANAFHYGRTDLLNYLLNAARANAIEAIAACRRKDIPCLAPLYRFESGEMTRDDAGADKVDVLISYWTASLQAKVLLMSCGAEVPNVSGAPTSMHASSAANHTGTNRVPIANRLDTADATSTSPAPPIATGTATNQPQPIVLTQKPFFPSQQPPKVPPLGTANIPRLPGAPQPKNNVPGFGGAGAILFWYFVVRPWFAKKKGGTPPASPPPTARKPEESP